MFVWSWYYGPMCFLPWVSWLKNIPLSTRCMIDSTIWLIHTHKHTCHNPCLSIGCCASTVSKATLAVGLWLRPFRKESHVNKPGMCSRVSPCASGKQKLILCAGTLRLTYRITCFSAALRLLLMCCPDSLQPQSCIWQCLEKYLVDQNIAQTKETLGAFNTGSAYFVRFLPKFWLFSSCLFIFWIMHTLQLVYM